MGATGATGDVVKADGDVVAAKASSGNILLTPLHRLLPKRMPSFLALIACLCAGVWIVGLVLAPDRARFIASPEWRFMPFYLAAHFIAVRLFVSTFTRNFRIGVQHLDVAPEKALRGVRWLLSLPGAVAAALIAAPFAYFDYRYLTGAQSRYERMGPDNSVATIDLLMWGTWVVEWWLNALIWVLLLGFLVTNCVVITKHAFRAPIEIVVAERHYKPFLQMSAEGASIVLGFSAMTIFYLWYTGGEITDYVGLAITSALLAVGFLPPFLLLRSKVREAVEAETKALRVAMAAAMWRDRKQAAAADAPAAKAPLEQRLEEALALFRISYLEHLRLNLGGTEARAIMLRLAAPGLGVAAQLTQNHQSMLAKVESLRQSSASWLSLLGWW